MTDIWNQITESFGGYAPKLLGAVAILIIGWLFALLIAAFVRAAIRRLNCGSRLAPWIGEEEKTKSCDVEKKVGKGVFWLIMLIVFIAFFQALDLTLATQPLSQLLNQVFEFIPKIVGALILLLIAWVVATTLRLIVTRALTAAKFDERIGGMGDSSEDLEEPGKKKAKPGLTKTIGDAVYWLIFLLFLPAILGALALEGLLEPVQALFNKLLGFLPNILAAALIAVIGIFVARIVQRIVTNLLAALGIDGISERVTLPVQLSRVAGMIVYIFILIPVIIAALNALDLEAVTRPASNVLNTILLAIPNIFAAALVLTIAYILGRVVSGLVTNLLSGLGFNGIFVRLGLAKEEPAGEGRRSPSEMAGTLVLVAIMFFSIFEASGLLGFDVLAEMVSKVTVLAGHIILGLLILGVGLYLANLAAKAVEAGGSARSGPLSVAAKVAILLLFGAMALRQMGLANEIIELAFSLLLGAAAVAVAIAFGVGGRDVAARKLKEWTESTE